MAALAFVQPTEVVVEPRHGRACDVRDLGLWWRERVTRLRQFHTNSSRFGHNIALIWSLYLCAPLFDLTRQRIRVATGGPAYPILDVFFGEIKAYKFSKIRLIRLPDLIQIPLDLVTLSTFSSGVDHDVKRRTD